MTTKKKQESWQNRLARIEATTLRNAAEKLKSLGTKSIGRERRVGIGMASIWLSGQAKLKEDQINGKSTEKTGRQGGQKVAKRREKSEKTATPR